MSGMFITFEGPEGAGKTTVIRKVYEEMERQGYAVMATREPGGIDIAEQIREVILNEKIQKWTQKQRHCFMQQLEGSIWLKK